MISALLLLLATAPAQSDAAYSLTAPATAAADSEITVAHSGDVVARNFITIVKPETPAGSYGDYAYIRGATTKLFAPFEAGDYEIRLLGSERPYPTLATTKLTVTPITADFEAPATAAAGSTIDFVVNGPHNPRDYVTIVAATAPERSYEQYVYTQGKSELSIRAPDDAGDYELRYLTGRNRHTVGRTAIEVTSVSASISAPASAGVNTTIDFTWEGPANQGDYFTIVPVGTPDNEYRRYVYTTEPELELLAPGNPGDYELRYLTKGRKVLARQTITITADEVTLDAVAEAPAGSEIQIRWEGPNNDRDYLTIVAPDAADGDYGRYTYTSEGNPVTLRVPDVDGTYEIRYQTDNDDAVYARRTLIVGATSATLEAPSQAPAGSNIEVSWTGPGNRQDYLTIVTPDTEDGRYERYEYVRAGNPITLTLPDQPGNYEIRYQSDGTDRVITRRTIEATDIGASVSAPDQAEAMTFVDVTWEGPDNRGDYIAFTLLDNAREYRHYRYTRDGSPARLRTPQAPGRYAVHYLTGGSNRSLARVEIEITPSQTPGQLIVTRAAATADGATASGQGGPAVAVVIDASGSMLQRLDGERRIAIARNAVAELIGEQLAPGTPFALRAFGHRQPNACDTELLLPLGALDRNAALAVVNGLEAKNLAKTPIADSLAAVPNDLAGVEGEAIVVLVTDGEETCDGDPAAVIADLRNSGFDIRVNIVGFAIDEFALKQQFEAWARLGGGDYFDAQDSAGLSNAIRQAVAVPFTVVDREGNEVAAGVANGQPLTLLPGMYTLVVDGAEQAIEIKPSTDTNIEL